MKNLFLIQPAPLLRKLYPKAVWKIDTSEKIIYLTFDDGPIPGLTEWILEELKKYNAKATFFCVGDNILKNPSIFKRIKEEKHAVGNHTMHHLKGFKTNLKAYLEEVEDCNHLISNKLFRPPYGQLTPFQYRDLHGKGYKIILWDVISYDYEKINPAICLKNVIKNTKEGSIVLFHDNIKAEKNLRYTLPLFLKHFANLHFQFKALEL